jgi:hypothetical protein
LIRSGKPLYQAAFSEIVADSHFAATMELQMNQYLSAFETAKLQKYEEELMKLGMCITQDGKRLLGGGYVPKEVEGRVKWLTERIGKKHALVAEYEKRVGELKKEIASRIPTSPAF